MPPSSGSGQAPFKEEELQSISSEKRVKAGFEQKAGGGMRTGKMMYARLCEMWKTWEEHVKDKRAKGQRDAETTITCGEAKHRLTGKNRTQRRKNRVESQMKTGRQSGEKKREWTWGDNCGGKGGDRGNGG